MRVATLNWVRRIDGSSTSTSTDTETATLTPSGIDRRVLPAPAIQLSHQSSRRVSSSRACGASDPSGAVRRDPSLH